jgi:ABC-type maltose transport system permease subunit
MPLKLKLRYTIPIFLAIFTMIIMISITPIYSSDSISGEKISDDGTITAYHEVGPMEQITPFSQILMGALIVSCFVGMMSYTIIVILEYALKIIRRLAIFIKW